MRHIGFTGTRKGLTDFQAMRLATLLDELGQDAVEVHHGDCVGADAEFHEVADNHCFDITIHPPDDDSRRAFCTSSEVREPKPYLKRNRDIVDETTILIACPWSTAESQRSGTWSTIRYARQKILDGKEQLTYIISPSGEVRIEGRR